MKLNISLNIDWKIRKVHKYDVIEKGFFFNNEMSIFAK